MTSNDDLAVSRKKFFEDSSFNPVNQKYGLFSFSGTLAVSKEPFFRPTPCHKDSEGQVVTAPHNFLVPTPKTGKTVDALFSAFEYKCDRYNDPVRANHSEKERTDRLKKVHDNVWKPAAYVDEPVSLFPHQASEKHTKISRRLADGSVRTDAKNILTSPPKKGEAAVTPGVLFGPVLEHMTDEYDRKLKTARDESKKSRAKRHGGAFKSMDAGNRSFNTDESIYGGKFNLKEIKRPRTFSTANHDRPFYPSNPGKLNCTIGVYPEHMPDPPQAVTRKKPSEATPWKVTIVERSKPTPSVTSNIRNIRNDFPVLKKFV